MSHFRSDKLFNVFLIIVGLLFAVQLIRFYPTLKDRFIKFEQAEGNYNKLRDLETMGLSKTVIDPNTGQAVDVQVTFSAAGASEADKVLPKDAAIDIVPREWLLTQIMTRYVLYPRKVREGAPYMVDVFMVNDKRPQGWSKTILPSQTVAIYTEDGRSLVNNPDPPVLHWSKVCASVIITGLMYLSTGFFLCAVFSIPVYPGGRFWYVTSCYLLGFVALNIIFWIAKISGYGFTPFRLIFLWLIFNASVVAVCRKRIRTYISTIATSRPEHAGRSFDPISAGINGFMAFALGVLFVSIAIWPVLDWDGMLHWGYLAKIFAFEHDLRFPYPHLSYYPLLWPMHMASHWVQFQMPYDGVLSWLMAVNFILFIGQFKGCINLLGIPRRLSWLPVMLFFTFFYSMFFYFTYADVIFNAFQLAVIALMLLVMRSPGSKGNKAVLLLALAGLALIKLEGAVSVVILVSAFAWANRKHTGIDRKDVMVLLGVPVCAILAWIVWVKYSGLLIPISHIEKGVTGDKLIIFLQALAVHFHSIKPEKLGILVVILITVLLRKKPWPRAAGFLLVICICLYTFSYAAVLGVNPERVAEMVERAVPRLLFHASPILCVWWGAMLGRDQ